MGKTHTVTRKNGDTKVVPLYTSELGRSADESARRRGHRLVGRREIVEVDQVVAAYAVDGLPYPVEAIEVA